MIESIQPQSSGHGGRRHGAGRKLGSASKKTRAVADAAAESGTTPLEYMLAVMRSAESDFEMRFEAAKAAAPYIHPRLSAVAHSGELKLSLAEELGALNAAAGAAEGLGKRSIARTRLVDGLC